VLLSNGRSAYSSAKRPTHQRSALFLLNLPCRLSWIWRVVFSLPNILSTRQTMQSRRYFNNNEGWKSNWAQCRPCFSWVIIINRAEHITWYNVYIDTSILWERVGFRWSISGSSIRLGSKATFNYWWSETVCLSVFRHAAACLIFTLWRLDRISLHWLCIPVCIVYKIVLLTF